MLKLTDDDFRRLVDYMKKNYGIDLSKKRILIEGRLSNMVTSRGFGNFKEFIDFAFADKTGGETMQLVNKLTTNHTYFLREPEHFEFLYNTVLPYLEKRNSKSRSINIWCAASSTGQEPYSLAMTVNEYFGGTVSSRNIRILATDVDTNVLETARKGVYSEEEVKDVPAAWLSKYFSPSAKNSNEVYEVGKVYKISDRIRNMVEFRRFNLMDDIPLSRTFDLISCRNVMIYFDRETKNKLIERFYDVTNSGGYLFIGHAESADRSSRYTYVKPAVYRRTDSETSTT